MVFSSSRFFLKSIVTGESPLPPLISFNCRVVGCSEFFGSWSAVTWFYLLIVSGFPLPYVFQLTFRLFRLQLRWKVCFFSYLSVREVFLHHMFSNEHSDCLDYSYGENFGSFLIHRWEDFLHHMFSNLHSDCLDYSYDESFGSCLLLLLGFPPQYVSQLTFKLFRLQLLRGLLVFGLCLIMDFFIPA